MNQDIYNENNIQNHTTNIVPENKPVFNQEPITTEPEVMVQNSIEQPQNLEAINQETATPQPAVKKSKIIVLDEDPVKFEVPEIQTENVGFENPVEEPKQEEPQVQTGNIQF